MRRLRASVFTAAWLALISGLAVVGVVTCAALERESRAAAERDLETQTLLFIEQISAGPGRKLRPSCSGCATASPI